MGYLTGALWPDFWVEASEQNARPLAQAIHTAIQQLSQLPRDQQWAEAIRELLIETGLRGPQIAFHRSSLLTFPWRVYGGLHPSHLNQHQATRTRALFFNSIRPKRLVAFVGAIWWKRKLPSTRSMYTPSRNSVGKLYIGASLNSNGFIVITRRLLNKRKFLTWARIMQTCFQNHNLTVNEARRP